MKKGIMKLSMLVPVITIVAGIVFALPAFAGKVVFETNAPKTKIGDGERIQSYAPGFHNIAVDGDNVYTVYVASNTYGHYEVQLGISKDGGVTWGKSAVVAFGPDVKVDAAMHVGSDSEIHIAWDTNNGIMYSHGSVDQNNRWVGSAPVNLDSELTISRGWTIAIATDDLGGVHITFNGNGPLGNGIYYKKSSDGGNTFESISLVALTTLGQANLISDGNGNLYAAWHDTNTDLVFSKKPAGSSWSTPVKVNGSIPADWLSMAVLNASEIFIAWDSGANGEYLASTSDGGNTWTQHQVSAASGGWPSLVVDSQGVLSLGWIDWDWSKGVHFARSVNGGSNWSMDQIIEDDGDAEWPHLALDNSEKVVMMYTTYNPGVAYFTREK